MSARPIILKFFTVLIFLLWLVYLYTLGEALFTDIYKRPCAQVTMPIVVYAFMTGCLSFVAFVVFRVYAGVSLRGELPKPTENSRVTYVAHAMVAFICVMATWLSFTNLKTTQCQSFEPPVLPAFVVTIINVVNGFLSNEQFSATQSSIFTTLPDNLDVQIESIISERPDAYRQASVATTSNSESTIPKTD